MSDSADRLNIPIPRFTDRADRMVIVAIALLVAAIGLVIVSGDRVGIAVRRVAPVEMAASGSTIVVIFDESIDPASVEGRIVIDPPVSGALSVEGSTVRFMPATPLQAGESYTVTVREGIQAQTGRRLLADQGWSFRVRSARVAFLGSLDGNSLVQDIFIADPNTPDDARPLTRSERGVLSFDVSPGGDQIVYAELQAQGTVSLFLLDVETGISSPLLVCPDAQCTNPAWQPSGGMIAFERTELNVGTGMPPGVPRIWLRDMVSGTVRPLFTDNQRIGYMARWSPDGTQLASYDGNRSGIVIFDITSGAERVILTPQGEVGYFSPDGRWITFPKIVQVPATNQYVAHFVLVDLESEPGTQRDLLSDDDPNNDVEMTWAADSRGVIVARRTPGTTTTVRGAQLYHVDVETGEATPLAHDEDYSHSLARTSPDGEMLVFQRFALGRQGARPEIWTYHMGSGALVRVAQNGTFPRWLP